MYIVKLNCTRYSDWLMFECETLNDVIAKINEVTRKQAWSFSELTKNTLRMRNDIFLLNISKKGKDAKFLRALVWLAMNPPHIMIKVDE